jgi:hypothetical protein
MHVPLRVGDVRMAQQPVGVFPSRGKSSSLQQLATKFHPASFTGEEWSVPCGAVCSVRGVPGRRYDGERSNRDTNFNLNESL